MNTPALLALALLLVPCARQSTRLSEPPQEFFLACGSKELALRVGQSVELPKDFAGAKVTLRLRPTRHFEHQGLRLEYPQAYVWEFEEPEDGLRRVTLSGHTNVLTLAFHERALAPAQLSKASAQGLAESWGARAKLREVDLRGKGKSNSLVGWRVQCPSGGSEQVAEFFARKLGGGTCLLTIHDTLTEEGRSDPETLALLELLAETLEFSD